MITEFDKSLSKAWLEAACDLDRRIFVVTLISEGFNEGAGEAAIPAANDLVKHMSESDATKACVLLGASKLRGIPPQIAYTLPEDPKASAAAISVVRDFFAKSPDGCRYGLNYNRWDG